MKTVVRNIAAFIAGIILGSMVNMALITMSGQVIPPPAGVDTSNMESLKSAMLLFEPKHFVFPFLAHAMGALVGAFIASFLGATQRMKLALGIGAFFLLGGIASSFMLPAPAWFIALDLIAAYLPMGWLGGILAEKVRPTSPAGRLVV